MLPSTGYFKGINCPFYDSGLCERPYCHFRHVKKESQSTANDGIESGAILQKLVSAAVQKVLQQTEVSGSATTTQPTVTDNVEDINKLAVVQSTSKVTYNPTPISELKKINSTDNENNEEINEQKKRHIPVPYTPRKPASFSIKRPIETNGSSKPFIYNPPPVKYKPGCAESIQLDTYTPIGSKESTEQYLPGTEAERQEYTPDENPKDAINKRNYVPSDKNQSKKKILEYKPTKVNTKSEVTCVTYQPTPRSLVPCFSSDEDEPDNKKRKIANDLKGLDDLGPEFDILDQILDEEKPPQDIPKSILKKDESTKHIKENSKSNKNPSNKSHDKKKSDKKERSTSKDETKHGDKKTDSVKKFSHKSSSDKNKEQKEKKDKHSSSSRNHSNSRSSENSTKHLKSSSSKKTESRSVSSSKSDEKHNHKKSHKTSKEKDKHKRKERDSQKLSDHEDNIVEDLCNGDNDIDFSESDEESIALECKKIFEEYVPTVKTKIEEAPAKAEENCEEKYVPGKKRISRTIDKNIKVTPKPPLKKDYKVSAAQTMAERLAKVREYHSTKQSDCNSNNENKIQKQDVLKNPNSNQIIGNSKIRIAHVSYVSTLLNAKKSMTPAQNEKSKSEPSTSSTITQTVKKGTQRVAHIPNEKFIDRPGVLEPLASKIPANIRSTYLNMMIDECLKLYLTATDAYARAQHEELSTSKKCSTVPIYKNSAVLAVSRLRKELLECNGVKKSGSDCSTLQKIPGTLSGKTNNAGSWSIESKNRKNFDGSKEFTGAKFYTNITRWVLTEEQLKDNGFPRPHISGVKGKAIIYGQNRQKPPKGYIRTCCRCKKEYTVNKKGFPAITEECIYHPNNKYRVRGEARYQCCSQDATSDGCCIAPSHVYEYIDFENLNGYVKTLPPENVMDDYGIYSLDCEMCYTTQGLDLTRVTVINSSCKVVYETLIKPLHPIIDYNTRYSGITEEQMLDVKTTLLEVQATLLAMFNSKTILIGHSLESDFKALKLIHDTVVDTSIIFPHKMGPPFKRALRNLSSEYLKKIIQNSVDGHDSAEDATVCMELIHYKLKEELKTR